MKKTFIKYILSQWKLFIPFGVITAAMIASFIGLTITEGLKYGIG